MRRASQSFLGLTHRMAEIRQNGRLQILPSAIRIALLSCSHLSHLFFLSPYVLSLPLSKSYLFSSLSHMHTRFNTNTFLLSLTPCPVFSIFWFFWLPLSSPLLQPVKSLCFSSPLPLLQTVFIRPHHIW